MEKLVEDGMIRFIGVSNFDVRSGLDAAEKALSKHRLACNQLLYHLGYRGMSRHILPYCANRGIAVIGYSPFGHGVFPPPESIGGRGTGTDRKVAWPHSKASGTQLSDAPSKRLYHSKSRTVRAPYRKIAEA